MSRDDPGTLAAFGGGISEETDDEEPETEDTNGGFEDRDGPECVDCERSTPTTGERVPYGEVLCPSCWLKREGLKSSEVER